MKVSFQRCLLHRRRRIGRWKPDQFVSPSVFLSGATTQVGRAVAMIGSALGTQPKASAAHGKLDLVTALDMEREQENHILGAVVCSLLLSDLRPLISFSASRRLAWMAGLPYIYRS
jgi:hypothetical protein